MTKREQMNNRRARQYRREERQAQKEERNILEQVYRDEYNRLVQDTDHRTPQYDAQGQAVKRKKKRRDRKSTRLNSRH